MDSVLIAWENSMLENLQHLTMEEVRKIRDSKLQYRPYFLSTVEPLITDTLINGHLQ
jgi:hypothetical protein